MSKSTRKPVSARTIREAFQNGEFEAPEVAHKSLAKGARGRLHPEGVKAYLKANRGATYSEKSDAEALAVEVPYTKRNKRGHRLSRTATLPVSEVRRLAGIEGRRGRLPKSAIEVASEHLSDA